MALVTELQQGGTIEEAIDRRRTELHDLLTPFDAVHLLGQLIFSEAPMNPETYVESEHGGGGYVVEMVAAELITRTGRAGTSEITPAIDANPLGHARELCQEAAFLESLRRVNAAGGLSNAESAARGRAASQHLLLRGPGWPWQEHRTLRGLFGPDRFAQRLRTALGFDVEDATACSEAVARLVVQRAQEHMDSAGETAQDFGEGHPAHRWATVSLRGWQEVGPDNVRAHAITALWAMNHLGDALLLDGDSLAEAAGIEPGAAAAFLSALSLASGHKNDDWFRLAEAVRFRPFVDFGTDGFMPTIVGNDLWALRGTLEHALKNDDAYTRHRARWLEERAAEVLAQPLQPDEVHLSVDYAYDAEVGSRITGEMDALLLCGDTAIVIEAKGATCALAHAAAARRSFDTCETTSRRPQNKAPERDGHSLTRAPSPKTACPSPSQASERSTPLS